MPVASQVPTDASGNPLPPEGQMGVPGSFTPGGVARPNILPNGTAAPGYTLLPGPNPNGTSGYAVPTSQLNHGSVAAAAAPKATGPVGFDGKPISQATADYFNEAAAVAGPETLPGVDMSGYIGAYNDAYNQQMASIKAGLQQSLGQVQVRRDQAAGIVAKMPQQLNSDYATVAGNEAQMAATDNAGLTGRAKADAVGAGERGNAVLQENRQAQKDTSPYMQLGITANQQADEAALNSSANSAEAAAGAQKAQAEEQMYLQQASAATQYANARQDRIAQFTQSTLANKTALEQSPARNPAFAAAGLTQGQVDQVTKSPQYTSIVNQINNGKTDTASKEYLAWELRQPGNEALNVIVQAENPEYFKGVSQSANGAKVSQGVGPFAGNSPNPLSNLGSNVVGGTKYLWQQTPWG